MDLVLVEAADGVGTITLNDPERRNAVTLDMCRQLDEAITGLEADATVNALVITGEPPAFCAGADLTHLGESAEEGLLSIYEGFLRVGRSPLPTIAAVNGAAVGAGMNLALICDVRLAGRSARFDDRFLSLGIHPGGGHTWMFQNIAGPQATAAAVLFGEVLDGEDAARVGLAWRCVDDDQLLGTAHEMAARAGAAPRDLVLRTKQTIQDIRWVTSQRAAVDHELGPQAWSTRQPAFAEKLAKLKARISARQS
jgi:enoyl-CoA hydratase